MALLDPSAASVRPLVLVDSSAWIEAIHPRGLPQHQAAVRLVLKEGLAATCEVVVAEVLRGAATPEALAALADGLSGLHRLDMDGVGGAAGALALSLRSRGLALPTTDLLIAATCALHGATLLHRDQHLAKAAEVLGLAEYPVE